LRAVRGQNRLRGKANFVKAANMFAGFKSSRENNSLFQKMKSGVYFPRPARQEGRCGQPSPDARRDAMDALARETNAPERTAKSCGPDSPTLESSFV